jgi:hypothetical protein
MGGGSSHDSRSYRDEKGWYDNTHRTYSDGTREERNPGWYGGTNWKDSTGNSGTERTVGGTTYRTDKDGNTSYR